MTARLPALLSAIAAFAVATPARAAGPYYVEPGPSAHHGLPCDALNPCAIDWALDANHLPAGSTVLIEAGTYDVTTTQPDVVQPLTIEPDPAAATVPVITSGGSFQPTLRFDTGSDGSRLTGVNVVANGLAKPALQVTVPATIDHVVVSSATTGVVLGAAGTLSDATVSAAGTTAIGIDAAPTASVTSATVSATGSTAAVGIIDEPGSTGGGRITDTRVQSDGIGVEAGGQVGSGAVMRRLDIAAKGIGVQELSGPTTLTDSLVTSASGDGVQANNGMVIARNDTVLAPSGNALHANTAGMSFLDPGKIDVRNTIARGAIDVRADPIATTGLGCPCPAGVIDIGYSSFVSASGITDLGHNQSGNPLFAGPGDFRLVPGSPAIDAGVDDPADGPTDLGGQPRIQGAAPDLGAYESTPIPATAPTPTGPPAGPPAPADTTPPSITGLSMSHRRFADRPAAARARGHHRRVVRGTAFAFTISEAARVTIAIVAESGGRRSHGRCVRATRRLAHARRCTRVVPAGTLVHAAAKGRVSVAFGGRIGKHTLAPGRYRAVLTAVDAAGNHSAQHSVAFTIVAA